MRRILIISYFFAPKNEIGAVRISKFVKYLVRLGWEVDVVTYKPNPYLPLESKQDTTLMCEEFNEISINNIDFPRSLNILYKLREQIGKSNLSNKNNSYANLEIKPTVLNLNKILSTYKFLLTTYTFTRAGKKVSNLKDNYDVVFSSYGPYSMLDLGLYYSKKYPTAVYIQDIRDDIVYLVDKSNKLLYRIKSYLEQRMLKNVDGIVIASEEAMGSYRESVRTYEVTNGFDNDDRNLVSDNSLFKDGYFHIYYGGRIYPKQDVSMLVEAIKKSGLAEKIKIHYAGKDFQEFVVSFKREKLEQIVINHGFIERQESLRLQEKCNALLLLSWNNTLEKGMITGKAFELISSKRPIICLITGNIGDSRLEEIFSEDEYRECFYYHLGNKDLERIQIYLKKLICLSEDKNINYTEIIKSSKSYEEYSYLNLTMKLNRIFEEEIKKKVDET